MPKSALAFLILLLTAACGARPAAPPVQEDAGGAVCGGYANPPCAGDTYCAKSPRAARGADIPGRCRQKPQMCPTIYQPVCGDNLKTYPNACRAAQGGVNVLHDGECPPATQRPSPPPGSVGADCAGMLGRRCNPGLHCQMPNHPLAPDEGGTCQPGPARSKTR
jgi:hypothetical protein